MRKMIKKCHFLPCVISEDIQIKFYLKDYPLFYLSSATFSDRSIQLKTIETGR